MVCGAILRMQVLAGRPKRFVAQLLLLLLGLLVPANLCMLFGVVMIPHYI
jgi:hypothetical protein